MIIIGLLILYNLTLQILITSSKGTLVKNNLTSNDTIKVLIASVSLILSMNVKINPKQYAE